MPVVALLLLIATLLPLGSFTLLVFVGKRMGRPLAGVVGTLAIAVSFFCSLGALMVWMGGGVMPDGVSRWGAGVGPIQINIPWVPTGWGLAQDHPGFLDIGMYIDSLTLLMFLMVTLVSTLVHIFSLGYMAQDKRFARFFTYLGLFCFSMLGLVLGGTLLHLFIFWELVGLCSYLLIGFWYEKKSASNAAIKAFVTNRVGDFGFLIGLGILFYHLGNVSLPRLWALLQHAGAGQAIDLPGGISFSAGLLTIMGIGLFFGAVGKSAQFPLHVWLPDAMEGPTPVSALIHAATMVAAGVYLVGRIYPILTPDARWFIAVIGCITLTMAALIAVTQSDIKKVLAYSTLSQLGYMILAMGVGSWMGGLFHLITHAFFKALLFLGSGSVIHAAHHEQQLPQYGGLIRKIPVTAITFLIAVLAIAGTPFFSGFYSKDTILAHAGAFASLSVLQGHSKGYWLFFILPVVIAYITPFYMMRCWTLTFLGKPRNEHLHKHAHESSIMWWPLVILAGLSIFGGYMGVQLLLRNTIAESHSAVAAEHGQFVGYETAWQGRMAGEFSYPLEKMPTEENELPTVHQQAEMAGEHLMRWVTPAFAVGITLGLLMYLRGYGIAAALMRFKPLAWAHRFLYRKMYFDELYNALFVGGLVALSRLAGLLDRWVVDGLVNAVGTLTRQLAALSGLLDKYVVDAGVTALADTAQGVGLAFSTQQNGRIRFYVMALAIALAVGAGGSILLLATR